MLSIKTGKAGKTVSCRGYRSRGGTFEDAQETAIAQLGELYDKAMEDVGEANAAIFEVHQMMLMDLDYVDSIKNIITTQEVNAEYAVATTGDNFSQMFASMMMLTCRDVRPM